MTYVVRGNALKIPMADESVDLIITSPPYFALRSYRDGDEHYKDQIGSEPTPREFLEALWAVMAECWRVLKPEGSCWVNLGDKYAGSGGHNNSNLAQVQATIDQIKRASAKGQRVSTRRNAPDSYNKAADVRPKSLMGLPWSFANGCIGAYPFEPGLAAPDGQTWILRAEVIWDKPNGLPESVTDRVRRSHEQWFMFTKSLRYFSAIDEIREPHVKGAAGSRFSGKTHNGVRLGDGHDAIDNPLGRLPGSVWAVPSEPLTIPDWARERWNLPDHFAAFPQEFPRRIILGWSPSGICQECGEGRRPVVESKYVPARARPGSGEINRGRPLKMDLKDSTANRHSEGRYNDTIVDKDVEITGYACACPNDSAPTRKSVILDPFGGTGTVAMVAKALGRTGISLDLSADYCRLADWRINHSGHAKKAEQRTWKERQGAIL